MKETNPGMPDSNMPDKYAELRKLMHCFEIEIIDAMNKIKAGKNTIVFFNNLNTFQELQKYLLRTKNKEIKQYIVSMRDTLIAKFAIDIEEPEASLIREYRIEDTSKTRNKKGINVSVFETKHPGILIEKYVYDTGNTVWALRADK